MAEQEQPIFRRVALKIIKLGMDSKQVVARFEAERQALAIMDHPSIAKVFDGGATVEGRLYFVMEYIRGLPVTRYCDSRKLDTKQRLQLFLEICGAVQHAHQKGIIHRDIKPTNILVAEEISREGKAQPVPKVIDFGIAKATQYRLTEKTLFTRYDQAIGTPMYMSPEQVESSGLDIDTRTDVYSLGVLLYEILTGMPPFDRKAFEQARFREKCRFIQEEEPLRPSTRLTNLTANAISSISKSRKTEPQSLRRLIKGDLDWIVMKALEKDRNRRYETANGLAMDIERQLNNEPVVARPPSNVYRFQKLVRRHKLAFTSVATVGMVLLVG